MAEVESVTAPLQNEALADVQSSEEATTIASDAETETETDKETLPREPANGVKKENVVPPKRGLVAAKRPTSTSAATKSTASSATRTTGGLSKPPVRPVVGAVRKPTSATAPTSSSASHRSQASIGGSGDEKKKIPLSSTRRTSLAPTGTNHTLAKTETLAEKRGATSSSTTTVRKPATSLNPTSPKATVKSNLSSTSASRPLASSGTTTSRSAQASKPATTGTGADARKRLSATSGATSGTASKAPAARVGSAAAPSTFAKEVTELKAKLEESEKKVEELQAQLISSQGKLTEFGKQAEDEAQKVSEAQGNIRTEHNDLVEKLHAKHKTDVEELQAQLVEAEAANMAAQESSSKAIEEAQQAVATKGASETASALEKLKNEHASALAALRSELISTKEAHADAISETAAMELEKHEELSAELAALKSQLEQSKAELEVLKIEHETALAALQRSLEDDHTSAIEALKIEHEAALAALQRSLEDDHTSAIEALKLAHSEELSRGNSDAASAYQSQIAELSVKHELASGELQKQLEEASAARLALEASHKESSASQVTEAKLMIAKLEEEIFDLKANVEVASTSLNESSQKSEDLEMRLGIAESQLIEAQDSEKATSEKLEALQNKDGEDVKAFAAVQEELSDAKQQITSLQKMLDTFDEEGRSKDELHNKTKTELAATAQSLERKTAEIVVLQERHEKEQEKHKKELQTITKDYETEIEALQGNTGIREELEALKAQHSESITSYTAAIESHAEELEKAKQDHISATAALDLAETAHIRAVEGLKSGHEKSLDDAHDRAISASQAAYSAELEQLHARHIEALAALRIEHEEKQASALSNVEKLSVTQISLEAEVFKAKDSFAASLVEINGLKEQLALEKMAKTAVEADLDAIKSKKPDTSEADALREELQALKDQHQAALMAARQESAKATEDHLAAKAALEKAQDDLQEQIEETKVQAKNSSADYKNLHDSLGEIAEEANKKAVELEARLKEAEAKLKVAEAELVEEMTKSAYFAPPKTPTMPKSLRGLAASKYADPVDEDDIPSTEEPKAAKDEHDSSSTALASIAKASLIAKQLEQMNEELEKDNKRSLESISDTSPSLAT